MLKQIRIAILLALPLLALSVPVDTTTCTNKYSLYNLASAATTVPNAASALFPPSVDTQLYLGDQFTGAHAPSKNVDYGLTFEGKEIALIKSSNILSTSSNWI